MTARWGTGRAVNGLLDDRAILGRIAEELARSYAGCLSPETVSRYVTESHALLAQTARISTHLPALTRHFAADRLRALALLEGTLVSDRPEILVACVKNAGRSVAAKLLLEHYGRDLVTVRSAGSAPGEGIHAEVAEVLTERGLDVSQEFPKPFTDEMVQACDVVITMGCGEACPVFPGKRYLDWPTDDPKDQPIDVVRRIVDDIDTRVRGLLTDLIPGAALPAAPAR